MKPSWKISRRALLGGAGSLIALPLLEQMMPTRKAWADTPLPGRLIVLHWPTGVCPDKFQPTAANGAALTADNIAPILQPLADKGVLGDTTIVSNLANEAGVDQYAGDHARGTGTFLTCTKIQRSLYALSNGMSVDAQVAAAVGTGMRLPGGLYLGTNAGDASGSDCDSGYSCAYEYNTSWGANSTPIPEEDSPLNAFNRLFAGYDPTASTAQVQERLTKKKSILDYSIGQTQALQKKLNPRDSKKVDQFLTAIRDYETRLQSTLSAPTCSTSGANYSAKPADTPTHVTQMLDLAVLALSCDATPNVTFSYENTISDIVHSWVKTADGQAVTADWHIGITHDAASDASALAQYEAVNTWMMSQTAYLIDKLKSVTDPSGATLLDRTIVYSGTELGIGWEHDHTDLRLAVAGGKALGFTPGRHVVCAEQTPLANLYLTFLQALKVPNPSNKFGDDGTAVIAL